MQKGKRVKRGIPWRRLVFFALLAVFLFSGGNLIYHALEYRQGEETYHEAEELVKLPDFSSLPTPTPVPTASPTPTPDPAESESVPPEESVEPTPTPTPYIDPYADALNAMDFTALREANPQVVGWILIPGTTVSYPLLQAEDNTYYLNHTWKGRWSSVGAIFLECQSSPDLSDFHTIIYGHNMRNRTMFGSLREYRREGYWEQHPEICLIDDEGVHYYDIFAAWEPRVTDAPFSPDVTTEKGRQSFLDTALRRSAIHTGVEPTVDSEILTLSTCTGVGHATRWVIQAALRTEE